MTCRRTTICLLKFKALLVPLKDTLWDNQIPVSNYNISLLCNFNVCGIAYITVYLIKNRRTDTKSWLNAWKTYNSSSTHVIVQSGCNRSSRWLINGRRIVRLQRSSDANAAQSAFLAVCFNWGDNGEGGKRTRGAVLRPRRLAGSPAAQSTRKNHKHE